MNINFGFDISSSALTAQRLRMDVISSNIANAETTRASYVNGQYQPYKRKEVVFAPMQQSFSDVLAGQMNGNSSPGQGLRVAQIKEDNAPFKLEYNPSHPDANADGYVLMPNVDVTKEMVDMISASRSYEANVTALNASKAMFSKALEIGSK
ncbi:flagellar basal body rod protein FlgC [Paenibacillus protaetiae]|uniref:Flagellar basal-body rod protein FlgC n=1 Tax=Paenibacillus protaetiae TaxID=2509456 RepID=A0A4P6ESN9_9BACL|nr:flagellar basal body rod protein FlgC [Paenibacillus protaetiae]QAY65596.1 flagellar basal body rod protein FlgC [Paenibacillus protaetiae]